MFTTFGQAITDVKAKFEGGVSFSIDWNTLSVEAARSLRKKVTPATIKRRVPIYGGMAVDLPVYTSPTDVHTPADIYPTTASFKGRNLKHQAAQAFFAEPADNSYTLDYINGIPFIFANIGVGKAITLLSVTDPDSLGGEVTMRSTPRNYIFGSNGIYGSFSDTLTEVTWDLESTQDLTEYNRGVVLIPFETSVVGNIAEIAFSLITSDGNFFRVSSLSDVIGNQYTTGWNLARLDLTSKSSVGTPNISSIASAKLEIVMETGITQEVTLDNITLHQTEAAMFEYYSTLNFRGTDGVWKAKPDDDDDVILFTDEAYDIWFYELCGLVVQDATYDGVDSKESMRFENKLKESLMEYRRKFPSMQKPQSYQINSGVSL